MPEIGQVGGMDQGAAHIAERLAGQVAPPCVHGVRGFDTGGEAAIGDMADYQPCPLLERVQLLMAQHDGGGIPEITHRTGLRQRQRHLGFVAHRHSVLVVRSGGFLPHDRCQKGCGLLAPFTLEPGDLLHCVGAVQIYRPLIEAVRNGERTQARENVRKVFAWKTIDRHAADIVATDRGGISGLYVLAADHAVKIAAGGRDHQSLRPAGRAVMQVIDQFVLHPLAPKSVDDLVGLHPTQTDQRADLILKSEKLPLKGIVQAGESGGAPGGLVGIEQFVQPAHLLDGRGVAEDEDAFVFEMLALRLEAFPTFLIDGPADWIGKGRGVARRIPIGRDTGDIGPGCPTGAHSQRSIIDPSTEISLHLIAGTGTIGRTEIESGEKGAAFGQDQAGTGEHAPWQQIGQAHGLVAGDLEFPHGYLPPNTEGRAG
jgi:hypothetical protein